MTATPPLTDEQHADIRAEILAALSEAGAFCGDCGFEPGETGCPDCVRVRELYANALTPLTDRLRAENEELAAELGARDEKARKRWIKNQEKQLGIKYADFRAGRWEMDLAMGREMAAAYVAMAKTLLGDAPNYSETKLEFDVKIAESPETYTLVVQRHAPGALTPHEARQRAEADRDRLRAERDQFADRVDTLTAVAKSNKQHVQVMYSELQKARAEAFTEAIDRFRSLADLAPDSERAPGLNFAIGALMAMRDRAARTAGES
jgi:hypothetical protein